MSDLDMSGVDPLRWAEVRRRVSVIKQFIAIRKPTEADRRSYAARLELSVNQFSALVRLWREFGQASAISGAGSTRRGTRKTGPRHLGSEVKDATRAVLESLGPDVPLATAVPAVREALAAKGLKAPSRSTIWNMLMEARQDPFREGEDASIIVAKCAVRLPVEIDQDLIYPEIALAVRVSTGVVIAASMATDEQLPKRLADALTAFKACAHLTVENSLGQPLEIVDCRPKVVRSHNYPNATCIGSFNARKILAQALGRGFSMIDLVYRVQHAKLPERMIRAAMDQPLDLTDAEEAVRTNIASHNAKRGAAEPIWVD